LCLLDLIRARQSVRGYKPDAVEEEKLSLVIEAGRLAPSAMNQQDWKFVIVREKELIEKLMHACYEQRFVGEAPVFLALCTDNHGTMRCGQPAGTIDCSIALSFMMLQAAELGLGTCWLGSFRENAVREILKIPDSYSVVATTPLGYPTVVGVEKGRKPLEEVVAYDDHWEF